MRNPKQLCKEHSLSSYQALKGAEVMAQAIAEDIKQIMLTTSTKPVVERIKDYLDNNDRP